MTQTKLMRTEEAAGYLGIRKSALDVMRVRGEGPDFVRTGRRMVRYLKEDLDEWINRRRNVPEAHERSRVHEGKR